MRREYDALMSMQRFFNQLLPDEWEVRRQVEAGTDPERPFAMVEQVGPAETTGAPNQQEIVVAYTISLYVPEQDTRMAADDAAMDLRELVWLAVKAGLNPAKPTTDRIPLYSYADRAAWQRIDLGRPTAGTWTLTVLGSTTDPLDWDVDEADLISAIEDLDLDPATPTVHRRGTGVFEVIFSDPLDADLMTLDTDDLTSLVDPAVSYMLTGSEAPWRTDSDWMKVRSFAQSTVRDEEEPTQVQVNVDLRCAFSRGLPLPFTEMLLQRVIPTP